MTITAMPEPITDEAAWSAALTRDRSYDGRFITGVLTTGIYCRPSCPARHPKRENVRFFADGAAARARRGSGLVCAARPTMSAAMSVRC